jgi:uncharacterized protein Veg
MCGTFDAHVAIYAEGGRKKSARNVYTIMKSLASTYPKHISIPMTDTKNIVKSEDAVSKHCRSTPIKALPR